MPDVRGIIAVVFDRSVLTYERAHVATAFSRHADRLGALPDQAVAVLVVTSGRIERAYDPHIGRYRDHR